MEECNENRTTVINTHGEIERNTLPYKVLFRRLQHTERKVENKAATIQAPPFTPGHHDNRQSKTQEQAKQPTL